MMIVNYHAKESNQGIDVANPYAREYNPLPVSPSEFIINPESHGLIMRLALLKPLQGFLTKTLILN